MMLCVMCNPVQGTVLKAGLRQETALPGLSDVFET
jgi:hypothetical protein